MNGTQFYHLNIQNRSLQGIERAPGRLDIFEEPIIRSLSSPDNLAIRKASTVDNPMLDTLPCEVLLLIANEVSALGLWEGHHLHNSTQLPSASQYALSRVSSRMHFILLSVIYRRMTYQSSSEWALNVLDVDSFFHIHGHHRGAHFLRLTRHLQFWAPIYLARFNRCAYYNIFRASGCAESSSTLGTSDDAKAHAQFLGDVAEQLQLVLAHLKPQSLQSFQSV